MTRPAVEPRLCCVVPFCKRTRGRRKGEAPWGPNTEWLCQEHWMMVPQHLRRMHGKAKRKKREAGQWIWRECKRHAIETAMGVRA